MLQDHLERGRATDKGEDLTSETSALSTFTWLYLEIDVLKMENVLRV